MSGTHPRIPKLRDSVEIFAPRRASMPDVDMAPTDTGILPKNTRALDPMKTPIDGEILVIELGGRGITELLVLPATQLIRGKLSLVLLYPIGTYDTSRIPEVRFKLDERTVAFAPMFRILLDIEFVRKCGRFTTSLTAHNALTEFKRMKDQGLFDEEDLSRSMMPVTDHSLRADMERVKLILAQAEKNYLRLCMAR